MEGAGRTGAEMDRLREPAGALEPERLDGFEDLAAFTEPAFDGESMLGVTQQMWEKILGEPSGRAYSCIATESPHLQRTRLPRAQGCQHLRLSSVDQPRLHRVFVSSCGCGSAARDDPHSTSGFPAPLYLFLFLDNLLVTS